MNVRHYAFALATLVAVAGGCRTALPSLTPERLAAIAESDAYPQVTEVVAGGPAAQAGLLFGDVIVTLKSKDASKTHYREHLQGLAPGKQVTLLVVRNGQAAEITMTLGRSPDSARESDCGFTAHYGFAHCLRSAQAGDLTAMEELASLYREGLGVAKDEAEALRWLIPVAAAGRLTAMTLVGRTYELGRGVTKDETEAVAWYRKAAAAGNGKAECLLGLMYEEGRGVAADAQQALAYFRSSAHHGYAFGFIRLGQWYWRQEQFELAGETFFSFQQQFPEHKLASRALLLAGQSYIKAKLYEQAVVRLAAQVKTYVDDKDFRPEALYWLADTYLKLGKNTEAYTTGKKLTRDYPESKWARPWSGHIHYTEDVYRNLAE